LAAFLGEAAFFAAFGFAAFLAAAAGFFVAVDLGFFGVVAFFTLGFAAFFVAGFFAPVDFAALVFFALTSLGFLVFAAPAAFGFELERGLAAFFGLAAAVPVDVVEADAVAELLAAVATFLAGLLPADLERARFFVPAAAVVDEAAFFGLVAFFAGLASLLVANLNEPLAPLPLVCLNVFAFTPFFKASLRC